MWELDHKEGWEPKNWWFQIVVLEKTLESLLDCKEIQPVHSEGDQCWVFIGRTDVEAEAPILWPRDVKSWLIWKDPDAGKDWGQEEKGTTKGEMVGWHYQLNGHGFGWTPGVCDGQGGLACCSPWGRKESDMTEQLNWLRTVYLYGGWCLCGVYEHVVCVCVCSVCVVWWCAYGVWGVCMHKHSLMSRSMEKAFLLTFDVGWNTQLVK